MSKTNNKHVVIFFSKEAGNYVVTDPKQWARANQGLFPSYTFEDTDTTPRTAAIVKLLHERFNFMREDHDGEFITVHYNLNPGLTFI
jgi:hypothetical protein